MAESTKITKSTAISAPVGRFKLVTSLPALPEDYYGGSHSLQDDEWRGGEIVYVTSASTPSAARKLFIQTATSGRTPAWKRLNPAFT